MNTMVDIEGELDATDYSNIADAHEGEELGSGEEGDVKTVGEFDELPAKLDEDDLDHLSPMRSIDLIRRLLLDGYSGKEVAAAFGTANQYIGNVARGDFDVEKDTEIPPVKFNQTTQSYEIVDESEHSEEAAHDSNSGESGDTDVGSNTVVRSDTPVGDALEDFAFEVKKVEAATSGDVDFSVDSYSEEAEITVSYGDE